MKVVLVAVGFSTRINEGSYLKVKPMIEMRNIPILRYVLKTFDYYKFSKLDIYRKYENRKKMLLNLKGVII